MTTAEAALDAAVAGLRVTRVLSYQAAGRVQSGHLVLALQNFCPNPVPVSLVYGGQGMLPLKLRALLDFVTPRLRRSIGALGETRR